MREQAKNKYREISDEEKDKKREYGRNRYQNMSEKNKEILKECPKKISKSKIKMFFLFLMWYKNGTKFLTFHKQCINKNAFHKNKDLLILIKKELEE